MRFIRRPKFEFSVFSFGIFDPRESLNVETLSILFLKEIVGRMKNPHLNKTKSASMVYLCLHRSRIQVIHVLYTQFLGQCQHRRLSWYFMFSKKYNKFIRFFIALSQCEIELTFGKAFAIKGNIFTILSQLNKILIQTSASEYIPSAHVFKQSCCVLRKQFTTKNIGGWIQRDSISNFCMISLMLFMCSFSQVAFY